jgi:hypothetical protein
MIQVPTVVLCVNFVIDICESHPVQNVSQISRANADSSQKAVTQWKQFNYLYSISSMISLGLLVQQESVLHSVLYAEFEKHTE